MAARGEIDTVRLYEDGFLGGTAAPSAAACWRPSWGCPTT